MFGRLFGRSGRVAAGPKKMDTCFQDVATDNLHCFQVSHFAIYFGAAITIEFWYVSLHPFREQQLAADEKHSASSWLFVYATPSFVPRTNRRVKSMIQYDRGCRRDIIEGLAISVKHSQCVQFPLINRRFKQIQIKYPKVYTHFVGRSNMRFHDYSNKHLKQKRAIPMWGDPSVVCFRSSHVWLARLIPQESRALGGVPSREHATSNSVTKRVCLKIGPKISWLIRTFPMKFKFEELIPHFQSFSDPTLALGPPLLAQPQNMMAVAGYSSIMGTAIRPQLSPAITLGVPDGTAQICSNHVQLFCDCDFPSISVRISGVCVCTYVRTYPYVRTIPYHTKPNQTEHKPYIHYINT